MGTTLGPSTKRPPTSTRYRALRLQCRIPSLLPLLAASMVSQQVELVLHQHAKRLPEQHTALETCQSTTPPWKLVKVSFLVKLCIWKLTHKYRVRVVAVMFWLSKRAPSSTRTCKACSDYQWAWCGAWPKPCRKAIANSTRP